MIVFRGLVALLYMIRIVLFIVDGVAVGLPISLSAIIVIISIIISVVQHFCSNNAMNRIVGFVQFFLEGIIRIEIDYLLSLLFGDYETVEQNNDENHWE